MDAHSVVDDWDVAPFDGGFAGLDELASRGFNGAVEANGNWLFLREGEPLAVVSDLQAHPHPGSIERFDGATGHRYEAPNPIVATLAAMLALDGDERGRYFTDDTPLEAVDETLTEGGFTGYVELSENVLSGDYYFVYVDGEVEHVGFVGSSQRLYGEDAESRATGEVGIYAVLAVSLPRPELPEPPAADEAATARTDSPASTAAIEEDGDVESDDATGLDESEGGPAGDDVESDPAQERESATESKPGTEPESTNAHGSDPDSHSESASVPTTQEPRDSSRQSERTEPTGETGGDSIAEAETEPETDARTDESRPSDHRSESDDDVIADADTVANRGADRSDDESDSDPVAGRSTAAASKRSSSDSTATVGSSPGRAAANPKTEEASDSSSGGIEAVTTRRVPSLDPENSGRGDSDSTPASARSQSTPEAARSVGDSGSTRSQDPAETESAASVDRLKAEYESRIETYETRIEELESEIEASDTRIGELEAELESIRAERDELNDRLDADDVAPVGESMPVTQALAGTSLFVRENTRGEGTLDDAHAGHADRETLASNLRIEYHTEFDDDGVSVEGSPFETWLRSSDTYEFVEWLVMELLFEIRSTGTVEGLRPLYDALPGIDRVGFEETIAVGDGTDGRSLTFDIVARDKKGNPLVIVEFDRRREPTRAETIEPLVTDASDVCEEHESLAAAIAITSSYFESDAMAAVEEATSTSLLSRGKHRSYVKLSRSNGFHLCLIEARDGSFNVSVPEL